MLTASPQTLLTSRLGDNSQYLHAGGAAYQDLTAAARPAWGVTISFQHDAQKSGG